MKDNFKFVETKKSVGLVDHLDDMAREEGRSLNNYVERVLLKHLEGEKNKDSKE